MKLRRLAGIAAILALVVGVSISAFATGMWPTFPVVGSASFCGGTSTGASGSQVCTTTVPAGPTSLTGTERIPADTQSTSGPFTVMIPTNLLGAGPMTYVTATAQATPFSTTLANTSSGLMVLASGAITATTIIVVPPPAPIDGQRFRVMSDQSITTLTLSANATQTIDSSTKPTAVTISTTGTFGYEWIWRSSTATWYRIR